MKKIARILIVLLIALSLFGCQKKKKQTEDIYIVFTSDVHCGFEGNINWSSLKAYVNKLKSKHNDVLLVDCGDYLQGGPTGTLSKGDFVVKLMNDMGYDIVTVGNHEFDFGMERLSELMGEMQADIVVSNVAYTGNKENIFKDTPEYLIREVNGVKIGFLGILTPTTTVSSTPSNFMEDGKYVYDFYSGNNGQDLYDKVQEVVNEVRKQGADYVIALSHLGSADKDGVYNSISLISHTEGIDAVLDGHSHSVIFEDEYPNKNGEDVVVCSVGTKMENIGTVIIDDTTGEIQTVLISQYDEEDQETLNKLEEINKDLDVILSTKVTETDFDLSITDEEGIRIVRTRECNIGNLFADAFRYATGTQIGVDNGGGIRASIKAGEITYADLLEAAPFQNQTASVYATGQQILDYLEFTTRNTQKIYKLDGNAVGEAGCFAQVSGLKFTVDTSIESAVMLDENQLFCGFSSDARRVKDVYVLEGDEYVPIDKEKTYTVGSTNYLLFEPGDGNNVFNDCEPIIFEGITDVEALKNYIEEFGLEQYRTTEGRINIE